MGRVCQEPNYSCSACCGFYNIKFTPEERIAWLDASTEKFLQLDIKDSIAVYQYRCKIEPALREKAIVKDVYICPFIGWIDRQYRKTGCLLHPAGSPHKEIHTLDHPQSHSFYGESICTGYECVAKSKNLQKAVPDLTSITDPLLYGAIASNHNILRAISLLETEWSIDNSKIMPLVVKRLRQKPIPVTSFEMELTFKHYKPDELWSALGTLLDEQSYGKDAFVFTQLGRKLGLELKRKLLPGKS